MYAPVQSNKNIKIALSNFGTLQLKVIKAVWNKIILQYQLYSQVLFQFNLYPRLLVRSDKVRDTK